MISEKKIYEYDTIFYYKPGTDILHNEHGPAVEWSNGTKYWCINGKLHRTNGPAVEHAKDGGDNYYYINGKLHRTNGPAIECANGSKHWFIEGVEYSEEEYWKHISKDTSHLDVIFEYCAKNSVNITFNNEEKLISIVDSASGDYMGTVSFQYFSKMMS